MYEALPLAFRLNQNYPNPFKETTRITFCVAYRTRVHLTVMNSEAEVIDTLVDEEKNAGTYEVTFVACLRSSGEDRDLASGKYCYRMQAGEYLSEKELEFLK